MTPDDESLAKYGLELVRQAELDLQNWLVELATSRLVDLEVDSQVTAVAQQVTGEIVGQLRGLILLDIDQQRTTPLSIVRNNLPPMTALLLEMGAKEPARDRDSQRMYPEDLFGLAPGSLEEISAELQLAGIGWGAAKAHVHLKRRAE